MSFESNKGHEFSQKKMIRLIFLTASWFSAKILFRNDVRILRIRLRFDYSPSECAGWYRAISSATLTISYIWMDPIRRCGIWFYDCITRRTYWTVERGKHLIHHIDNFVSALDFMQVEWIDNSSLSLSFARICSLKSSLLTSYPLFKVHTSRISRSSFNVQTSRNVTPDWAAV